MRRVLTAAAIVAALVSGFAEAKTSKDGKTVTFRKWGHAIILHQIRPGHYHGTYGSQQSSKTR
jgi:hypothetical protein